MTPLKVFALLCSLVLCSAGSVYAVSGQLGDPIDGADHPHNFSINANGVFKAANNGSNDSTKICIFCHTPHGSSSDSESILWNRRDPTGPMGGGPWPLYADPAGTASLVNNANVKNAAKYHNDGTGGVVYPNGASRLCLSCHDGVSAIGGVLNIGDSPDPAVGIEMESGKESISAFDPGSLAIIDLATSHPISFIYNASVVTELNTFPVNIAPNTFNWPLTNPTIAPLDSQSRMQCTTCHDPHNDTRLTGDAGGMPLWRYAGGSPIISHYQDICDQCHAGSDEDYANQGGNKPHEIL